MLVEVDQIVMLNLNSIQFIECCAFFVINLNISCLARTIYFLLCDYYILEFVLYSSVLLQRFVTLNGSSEWSKCCFHFARYITDSHKILESHRKSFWNLHNLSTLIRFIDLWLYHLSILPLHVGYLLRKIETKQQTDKCFLYHNRE